MSLLESIAEPTIMKLRVGDLHVDIDVQRVTDLGRAETSISNKLVTAGLGVLFVSDRGDSLPPGERWHVIDGGHRVAGLKIAGRDDYRIDCQVFTGLSREQEAALFVLRNNSKPVGYLDKLKARWWERDPVAVDLYELLDRHNLRPANSSTNATTFAPVQTLELVLASKPDAPLTCAEGMRHTLNPAARTLDLIVAVWDKDPRSFKTAFVAGIGLFFSIYGPKISDRQEARLGRALARVERGDPVRFNNKVEGLRAATVGQRARDCVVSLLVQAFNDKCPIDDQLEPYVRRSVRHLARKRALASAE